jgi:tetratricopeptide (TPR) repeat protein
MEQPKSSATQLLVFDHEEGNFWGNVFEAFADNAVTLKHDLRMQDAIRQIATAGAATDPYAFFRKCMFEMGEAANKKNKSLLGEWGDKAIESGKKTGDKSLLATAYITYAGMLFNFKDHEHINELLDTGIRLCKQEIAGGNESIKPLLLQYYTYKGADCQIQKERREALEWFMKAGDEAVAFGFTTQAVSAYYKAWVFAEYKNWHDEKLQASKQALQLTHQLSEEEIQASEYPFMAYDYVQLKKHEEDELAITVTTKMIGAYGDDWQKTVEELKQNYTKKKIRDAKAGEIEV